MFGEWAICEITWSNFVNSTLLHDTNTHSHTHTRVHKQLTNSLTKGWEEKGKAFNNPEKKTYCTVTRKNTVQAIACGSKLLADRFSPLPYSSTSTHILLRVPSARTHMNTQRKKILQWRQRRQHWSASKSLSWTNFWCLTSTFRSLFLIFRVRSTTQSPFLCTSLFYACCATIGKPENNPFHSPVRLNHHHRHGFEWVIEWWKSMSPSECVFFWCQAFNRIEKKNRWKY